MEAPIIEIAIRWIVGLSFSLFFGAIAAEITVELIRNRYKKRATVDPSELKLFESSFGKAGLEKEIGFVERLFFTICVAFNFSGLVIAMIGWVTLKMVYIWGPKFKTLAKPDDSDNTKIERERLYSEFAMSSILGGMVSMIIALIAGLFCRYGLNVLR